MSFFIRHEVLWSLALVMAGIMMVSSFGVQQTLYLFNQTLMAYEPTVITDSYAYVSAINMLFFSLSLIFGIYDMVTKYGTGKKKKSEME